MADNSKLKIVSMISFFIKWVVILGLAFVFNMIIKMSFVPKQFSHLFTVTYPTWFYRFTAFWFIVLVIVIIQKFIEYKKEVRA